MAPASPAARNGHNNDALLHESLLPSQRQPVPTSSVPERVLSVSANLLHLLPTGAVMVFQTLVPSFTNKGECQHRSNWWLSLCLVVILAFVCLISAFTDSFFDGGKLYYGIATPWRLFIFNMNHLSHPERKQLANRHRLKARHLRWNDCLRGVVTAGVFVALAFNDLAIQNCFFPHPGFDAKQILKNMPLLVSVLSGSLLLPCQTRRNNIDFLGRTSVPDLRRPEYKRLEHSIADHQNLDIESQGFPILQPVKTMLQTWENRMTLVHDDLEMFHRARDDLLMLRRAPDEMRRIHSESNIPVPSIIIKDMEA
ncbi:hypothetical protein PVAP13_3NG197300 [Panicum virgatum]|uniref:Uncharacterized protein n=1 Tax=Panicum virgatum TaxID=38727 RepID=A0A8T0U831_PANVG|nr:hypothetical protein PVAP13_3NG197300 [Panicum virgatum]